MKKREGGKKRGLKSDSKGFGPEKLGERRNHLLGWSCLGEEYSVFLWSRPPKGSLVSPLTTSLALSEI